MKDINKLVGENIRAYRTLRQMSQEGLAKTAHIDQTYVSAIERGVRSPALDTLAQIAEALCCGFLDLLKDTVAAKGDEGADMSANGKSLHSKTESLKEMVIYTNLKGEKFEVPATPEGYAFLREIRSEPEQSAVNDSLSATVVDEN